MRLNRPRWARGTTVAIGALACALAGPAGAAGAHGRLHHRYFSRHAAGALSVPPRLAAAARAATGADRQLVADARALHQCYASSPAGSGRCDGLRHALQQAGVTLRNAELHLAMVAHLGSTRVTAARVRGRSARSNPREAPVLTVVAHSLRWTHVANEWNYVLMRAVPGQAPQYALLSGHTVTPPPVPGVTVTYRVRTSARWSAWSAERSISYAANPKSSGGGSGGGTGHTHGHEETPAPEGHGGEAPDPQAAPWITVSGATLRWNEVAGITTYVLVAKVTGQPTRYAEVTGTSTTPTAVPGATVRYSVRTAVEGSALSPEVSITYPSSPPPPPPPPPPPGEEGHGGGSNMTVSLDTGGWDWASAVSDASGAVKHFRASYKFYDSDSQMELLARNGVTLMPLFGGGGTLAEYNSAGFVGEIVNWFKRYGKGGTFWAGRPVDLGATTAELINEPGNPYFYPDYGNFALYANLTKAVHSALEANFASAVRPKLLVSYDGGYNGSAYGRAIFAAGAVADGVTVHPYGGHGAGSALGNRERVTQAHAETGLPVYVTEVGWPTATGMPQTGDSLQWTEQQQAENITNFISWARSLGYVDDVTYFNYADYGANDWYGIVNATGTAHKLGYAALKAAAAA